MDIGLVTGIVSIPLVGALGTVAWRIQATITARKQSEIDSLKTEIDSIRNIHTEQMTLMKEKNDLSVEQIETIVNTRAKEISTSVESTYAGKIRMWKSYGIVGVTSAVGMAVFVFGLLFSMFPRSAADNPVMTLTNAENVSKEITKYGLHNHSEAGSIIFAHGPTFMWGTILGSVILAISLGFILVNSFFKLKTPSEVNIVETEEEKKSEE
ncbi:hypothetical protein OAK52_01675 [Chloroflexi bacterium]|jgi:hypothetical protein|nr:hypothetical protein [Chloroflexota bacterium]MDC0252855.1 hypothetical protein [Chloroflexota bacterium]OUW96244.1 MAG: hypothetical protein CBD90_01105 [Chloroflexi bacterium TMED230]RZP14377.1 MAG: hypothetical protein EVA32_02080 [Chloroflexota bacterium]|tara:strand:- start:372 stop:1004 length:633 start_codon:yes stop_codon:yes gene_type:complete